jgi:predicted DNA-binding transcriptional regulator AlpA
MPHREKKPIALFAPTRETPCLSMRAERAAACLDISPSTFLTWVKEGKMPKPIKIGGVALYDYKAVETAWQALKDDAGQGDINPFD